MPVGNWIACLTLGSCIADNGAGAEPILTTANSYFTDSRPDETDFDRWRRIIRAQDEESVYDEPLAADNHGVFHASVTHGIPLVGEWNAYFEYFGLYHHGLLGGRPDNYFDTGVTYQFNNNSQFDARIGIGLNPSADNLFAGMGYSMRF